MNIGISTATFYPLETEHALDQAIRLGADCVEIFFNAFCETTPEFVRQLKHRLEAHEIKVTSIHPFTSGMEPMFFFSNYPRRFSDGMEIYKRYFEILGELGGKYLILHGHHNKPGVSMEQYVERYARLHQLGRSFGLYVAQENVARCLSRYPQLFERIAQAVPDAKFTLDVKQAIRSGVTVEQMLDVMGEHLAHIHISDNSPQCDCLPVGEGTMDFEAFFRRLRQMNYGGDMVLELYQDSYSNSSQLTNSIERLRRLWESSEEKQG